MSRLWLAIWSGFLFISACEGVIITPVDYELTPTSTISPATPTPVSGAYYVSPNGNDGNPGDQLRPWKTLGKAIPALPAGSTLYLRGGQYAAPGVRFANPSITVMNYPGEQAVIRLNGKSAFSCWWRQGVTAVKTDGVRILGTDVPPRKLSNGVLSEKGIVIQGAVDEVSHAIDGFGCDRWEVAGVDFVDTGTAIFTFKDNYGKNVDNSADHWYVHDNRVYGFFRESGMQFNGNRNVVENNLIYKITDKVITPYGCQMLNLLGNNNVVRGNTLSRYGSKASCAGILFEWDLSDANLIENNTIRDVLVGISISGGDGNTIQNNRIEATPNSTGFGIAAVSYDNRTSWPCNDFIGSGSTSESILPPNDAAHPDYAYYYPHDCYSKNNQIKGNVIRGFKNAWVMYDVPENSNVFMDNVTTFLP